MHPAWMIGAAALSEPPPLPWWRIGILAAIFIFLLGFWAILNRRQWTQANLKRLLALAPKDPQIVVKEQRWVNSKTAVCLIEVGGQRFLLAQSPGGVAWQPLPPSSSFPVHE